MSKSEDCGIRKLYIFNDNHCNQVMIKNRNKTDSLPSAASTKAKGIFYKFGQGFQLTVTMRTNLIVSKNLKECRFILFNTL